LLNIPGEFAQDALFAGLDDQRQQLSAVLIALRDSLRQPRARTRGRVPAVRDHRGLLRVQDGVRFGQELAALGYEHRDPARDPAVRVDILEELFRARLAPV
jgi:hypothetical protein